MRSWGSGANPWGPEKDDQFSKPNHYDGLLEIVGVTGVVHMGQIQSGLRSAVRIAQGGHVSLQSKHFLLNPALSKPTVALGKRSLTKAKFNKGEFVLLPPLKQTLMKEKC